jgi:hypothetical protein
MTPGPGRGKNGCTPRSRRPEEDECERADTQTTIRLRTTMTTRRTLSVDDEDKPIVDEDEEM